MSSIVVSGDTSGSITLSAPAVSGSSVLTLPVATDTLVGKATTDTLTNKTLTGAAMNGTVGATTPSTGAFTTLSATGIITSTQTAGQVLAASSGGTAILYSNFANTGGTFLYGIDNSTGTAIFSGSTAYAGFIGTTTATSLVWATNGLGRALIDSSGNLLVGTTSNPSSARCVIYGGTFQMDVYNASGQRQFLVGSGSINGTANGADAIIYLNKSSGTSRSINAAGTINASGADYAEYMTKADNFSVAKGDVVGINAQGKLTNVFANAISFVVKSTDPSYVGGDSWGVGFEDDAEGLEAARQLVDRIAFAGQVPVNVTGATAGQYIIPANDNGVIKGEAVSNPTFEQYQTAVGKVIAIESDGRAKIIVKVA